MNLFRRWFLRHFLNIKIYGICNIYKTAKIGRDTIIGCFSEVGDGVEVGERCKLGAYTFIPKGVKIGDEVFIGPAVRFTNDKYPKATGEWKVYETVVEDGASIGAGSTIICGVRIGRNAKVGAGSVVTRNVSDNETVYGVPAKRQKSGPWESKWKKNGRRADYDFELERAAAG